MEMKELSIKARDGGEVGVYFYPSEQKNAPLIFDIHGGGFCYGKASDDQTACIDLAQKTGFHVASLDYRLVPKHPFPVPLYDCYDAYEGVLQSDLPFDRNRLYAIGHSAGANAVAGLCRLGATFRAVVLNYPALNLYDNRRPRVPFGFFYFQLERFSRKYCPEKEKRKNPLVSPLYAEREALKRFPETLLITCGRDCLRVDGIAFEQKLKEAGVPVKRIEYERARHGFFEEVQSGRAKPNFYTSAKTVREHKRCYADALDKISEFFLAKNASAEK